MLDWNLLAPYLILMLSILSLFFPLEKELRKKLSLGALTFAVLAGWMSHRISEMGILLLVLFGGLSWIYFYSKSKTRGVYGCVLGFFCLLLGFHILPGFQNYQVVASPLSFYLNFDKPLVGFFLVLWGWAPLQEREDWKRTLKISAILTALSCFSLFGIAWTMGRVHWDPKWYSYSWIWLSSNLFLTSVAEEAFFRGLIQSWITKSFFHLKHAPKLGWIVTSLLFGLAHFPKGILFSVLACWASLFYGYAFLKTRRLEAGILTHFSVNAIHFIFFTYPI